MSYENIKNYILTFFLVISIICGGILFYRLGYYRKQCEQYRAELSEAENRQQELTATIRQCVEISKRADGIYSSTATSIRQLKEQLKEARKVYEDMAELLYNFSGNNANNNAYIDK